jgi:hydrogenase maturation protease
MNSLGEKIADAVLYEGYILYPYRPSAVKNQQRWNFGALCPKSYSDAQGGTESWTMQTECLVQGGPETELTVKVRFLHLLPREVRVPISNLKSEISDLKTEAVSDAQFQTVPALEVNGKLLQTWQEAVERDVVLPSIKLGELQKFGGHSVSSSGEFVQSTQLTQFQFSFPASEATETLRDEISGATVGLLVRGQQAIEGAIEISATAVGDNALKITIQILNHTPLPHPGRQSRDDALMRSFVSTHTILSAEKGEFVSLLDPPQALREAAAGCSNIGTYPVLVGEEGSRDCVLSSPIILYDYPQIAPESAGNLYDGTEIDEILTLRIMTLTDEEKREMRGADDRARQILERTETLPLEQLMKMHGAMKSVKR